MILLKSEMLDLLTDVLCLFEADLATLKFTMVSRPLETLLGYDVQGELSGVLVETVLPGLLTPEFVAAPSNRTAAVIALPKRTAAAASAVLLSVLIVPRATTAGRVVVGVASAVVAGPSLPPPPPTP